MPLTSPAAMFAVLFALVFVAPLAAQRLRVPSLVALVVGGVALGPGGFGVLERTGAIEQLGGAGLIYLMFLAGLELDLTQLRTNRRAAGVLSALTFALPFGLGVVVGLGFAYSLAASVLLGSLWASHTPLTYPMIRRADLQGNRAVGMTLGATIITDITALLVLAVVVEVEDVGAFDVGSGIGLIGRIAGLLVFSLVILPRLAAWLVAGLGQDRPLRVMLMLATGFAGAAGAEAFGIEPIIGAFLTGLASSRIVPRGGVVMERLEVVGSTLLIPIFLVSVGMLVEPSVALHARTLLLGVAFTLAAMIGKAAAAVAAGRAARWTSGETLLSFGLSNAQAAATLAATIVALRIGLFDEVILNAVLLVILVTVLVASWATQIGIRRTRAPLTVERPLGHRLVVPVADPETAPGLVELAARAARLDRGVVVPLHVLVDTTVTSSEMATTRAWIDRLERLVVSDGVEAHGRIRFDASVARGVGRTAREEQASAIVIGWSEPAAPLPGLPRGKIDEILEFSTVPVAVARLAPAGIQRLILVLTSEEVADHPDASSTVAIDMAARLGRTASDRIVLSPSDGPLVSGAVRRLGRARSMIDPRPTPAVLGELVRAGDLVVTPVHPARGRLTERLAALGAAAPDASLVVVSAPFCAFDAASAVAVAGISEPTA